MVQGVLSDEWFEQIRSGDDGGDGKWSTVRKQGKLRRDLLGAEANKIWSYGMLADWAWKQRPSCFRSGLGPKLRDQICEWIEQTRYSSRWSEGCRLNEWLMPDLRRISAEEEIPWDAKLQAIWEQECSHQEYCGRWLRSKDELMCPLPLPGVSAVAEGEKRTEIFSL